MVPNTKNCVHAHGIAEPCNRLAFIRRTHGWLCAGHYRLQQESIPAKPRLPQPKWIGFVTPSDDEIVKDIIAMDKAAIANGTVVITQRGVKDPVYLRTLEPPTVH